MWMAAKKKNWFLHLFCGFLASSCCASNFSTSFSLGLLFEKNIFIPSFRTFFAHDKSHGHEVGARARIKEGEL